MGWLKIRMPDGAWRPVSKNGAGAGPDGQLKLRQPDGRWKVHVIPDAPGADPLYLNNYGWETALWMADDYVGRWVAYKPRWFNVAPANEYHGSPAWSAGWSRRWGGPPREVIREVTGDPDLNHDHPQVGRLEYDSYPLDGPGYYDYYWRPQGYIRAQTSSALEWRQFMGELYFYEGRRHPEWGWDSWQYQSNESIPIDLDLLRRHFNVKEAYVEFEIAGQTNQPGSRGRLWRNDTVTPGGSHKMRWEVIPFDMQWAVGEQTQTIRDEPFFEAGTTLLGEWELASLPLPEYSTSKIIPPKGLIFRYPISSSDLQNRSSLTFQVTTDVAPEPAHSGATPPLGTRDYRAEYNFNYLAALPTVHFFG